jgi:hypothetical protein
VCGHLDAPLRTLAVALLLAVALPAVAESQGAASAPRDSATAPDSSARSERAEPSRPALDFSGLVFGSYQIATDDASRAAAGGGAPNKFDIGRVYLNFRMPAGKRFGARVTTDIKQQDGSSGADDGWIVRLKYAYLQYDFIESANPNGLYGLARVVMLHNVLIDHQQEFWPRYTGKVATETYDFFASADLGVAAQLRLPNRWGEVYATVVNGGGYEHPESDRFKDIAARVSLTPFGSRDGWLRTLTISPWIYSGKSASRFASDPADPIAAGLDRARYGVFAGVRDRALTLGAEWARKVDDVESGTSPLDRSVTREEGELYSAFAIARPLEWRSDAAPSPFGILFRWDQFAPDRDASGKLRNFVGGVFVEPTRNTALALDYQRAEPVDGLGGTTSERWYVHWQVTF